MPQITWLKLGITLGVLLFAFAAGFELRVLIDHSNERARLQAEAAARVAAEDNVTAASKSWEDQLLKLRSSNLKLIRRLHDETSKPVYSTCLVPDNGVQLYNDALGQATRGSNGGVP